MTAQRAADRIGFGPMQVDWEPRINWDKLRGDRLAKTKAAMESSDVDYLILVRAENARYAAGIRRLYWPTIQLGGGPIVVLARAADPAIWIIDPDFASTTIPWVPPDRFRNPHQLDLRGDVERFAGELRELFGTGLDSGRIALDIWSPAMVGVLQEKFPNAAFVDGQELMISARRQKTAEEIACMKMAYVFSEAGMQAAVDILRPGVREVELLGACLKKLWDFGSETTQCSEVVNSGPGGYPYRRFHADRIVQHGDLVNMDFGGCFNGYFGDYCRAFVCGGKPTPAQADLLKRAVDAQLEVFDVLKPGTSPAELCAKLGRRTMGHGLGIAAFESPHLRAIDDYEILPGMTFSITSPVLGSPEAGGVHLEDELYVTEDGVVVYSTYPYTLA